MFPASHRTSGLQARPLKAARHAHTALTYEAPRTISIVRPERTVVRDVDQALPIALSTAALLLALGGLGIALARTGVVRRGLANRTH
jgi:hypothetical protein